MSISVSLYKKYMNKEKTANVKLIPNLNDEPFAITKTENLKGYQHLEFIENISTRRMM